MLRYVLLFFLATGFGSCAEKRELPGRRDLPSEESLPSQGVEGPSPLASSSRPCPPSFAASEAARGILNREGEPAREGALHDLIVLDLNEDGNDEVILIPGPLFCGTGGCAPAAVYQEREGKWVEIGKISTSTAPRPVNDIEKITPLETASFGFLDLSISRRGPGEKLVARFDGEVYRVSLSEEGDLLPEEKASSLLLSGGKYDPMGGISLGLWDKYGENAGASAEVRVLAPGGEVFVKKLGAIGAPDDWHRATFPGDFAGAPEEPPSGIYRVEYRVGEKRLLGGEFRVP